MGITIIAIAAGAFSEPTAITLSIPLVTSGPFNAVASVTYLQYAGADVLIWSMLRRPRRRIVGSATGE